MSGGQIMCREFPLRASEDGDHESIANALNCLSGFPDCTTLLRARMVDVLSKALKKLTIAEQEPTLLEPERMLSTCQPFPWSRPVWEGVKTVFNLVPCDNLFERDFAKFLDSTPDVKSFSKLPQPFGFSIEYTDPALNLRSYYPDFIAVDDSGTRWILETKGAETGDMPHKDAAAAQWCENATMLTGKKWVYLKVQQKAFETLQPTRFEHLTALRASGLF